MLLFDTSTFHGHMIIEYTERLCALLLRVGTCTKWPSKLLPSHLPSTCITTILFANIRGYSWQEVYESLRRFAVRSKSRCIVRNLKTSKCSLTLCRSSHFHVLLEVIKWSIAWYEDIMSISSSIRTQRKKKTEQYRNINFSEVCSVPLRYHSHCLGIEAPLIHYHNVKITRVV